MEANLFILTSLNMLIFRLSLFRIVSFVPLWFKTLD